MARAKLGIRWIRKRRNPRRWNDGAGKQAGRQRTEACAWAYSCLVIVRRVSRPTASEAICKPIFPSGSAFASSRASCPSPDGPKGVGRKPPITTSFLASYRHVSESYFPRFIARELNSKISAINLKRINYSYLIALGILYRNRDLPVASPKRYSVAPSTKRKRLPSGQPTTMRSLPWRLAEYIAASAAGGTESPSSAWRTVGPG